jgi:type I restriction enzyme S subunit
LNIWDLRRVLIPTPDFEIQKQLAAQVTAFHRATESLVSKLHGQLALLQEYREALITAAVTGELDVDAHDGERAVEEVVAG